MTSSPPGLTVGYVFGSALASTAIEWFEAGAGPSHATTLVAPGYVIDARFRGGVDMRPVSYLAGSAVRWFRMPAPEPAVRGCIAFLQAQRGEPYAWQDILAFAVPAAFKAATGARHPWMCSWLQLAAETTGKVLPPAPVGLERLNPLEAMLMNCAAGAIALPGPIF